MMRYVGAECFQYYKKKASDSWRYRWLSRYFYLRTTLISNIIKKGPRGSILFLKLFAFVSPEFFDYA